VTEAEWLAGTDPQPMLELLRGRAGPRKLRLFGCACVRALGELLHEAGGPGAVEVAERVADGLAPAQERVRAAEAAKAAVDGASSAAREARASARAARRASYAVEGEAKVLARAAWVREAVRLRQGEALLAAAEAAEELVREATALERLRAQRGIAYPADASWAERALLLPGVRKAGIAAELAVRAGAVRDNWDAARLTPSFGGCLPGRWEAARRRLQQDRCGLLRCLFGNPFRPPSAPDPAWLRWNGGTVTGIAQALYDGRAFERMPVLGDALEDAGCGDAGVLGHCRGPGPHARGCWVVDLLLGKG
jgi:hypothetical protein